MSEAESILLVDAKNFHACAVEIEGLGVLIRGSSGSGKSSLAHGLVDHFKNAGRSAVWVSDDQVVLEQCEDSLWAMVPSAIAGKAELFGLGIIDVPFTPATKVCLDVSLVPDEKIERMPDVVVTRYIFDTHVSEIPVPMIQVPLRHEAQAIRLVVAKLAQLSEQGHG